MSAKLDILVPGPDASVQVNYFCGAVADLVKARVREIDQQHSNLI